MSKEPCKFKLYCLENIWSKERIEGLADEAQGKQGVLFAAAHLHVEVQDGLYELAGQGIHGGRRRGALSPQQDLKIGERGNADQGDLYRSMLESRSLSTDAVVMLGHHSSLKQECVVVRWVFSCMEH